jgi:hypothetical protein
MNKLIHNVRRQPEEVRRHILHITTIAFAVILFLLWVVSLGRSLSGEESRAEKRQEITPFSALKANLVGGYQSIRE